MHEARSAVLDSPAVRTILRSQYPAGYWMHPDLGIAPHYRATVWQVLFLAQFGIERTQAVERAVAVVLTHNRDESGAFRLRHGGRGRSPALTGALLWALAQLGFESDSRINPTWDWLTDQASTHLDPDTATWMLRAAAVWRRATIIPDAANVLQAALTEEDNRLPTALTFPLTLQVDRLAALEALVEVGKADVIPTNARAWLLAKRDARGFWPLEHIPGRLWHAGGVVGTPNPWVTVRARKVLKATGTECV